MKILQRIYSIYGTLIFLGVFVLLLPFFFFCIKINPRSRLVSFLNRIWAFVFYKLLLIPTRIEYRSPLSKQNTYIFCPNHFSFLDIPTFGLSPFDYLFVGKSSFEKVPVFGYMYKHLHITVDRSSRKSRYEVLVKAAASLDQGKSLVMYPEGGINSEQPPQLARFKDGPFRLAIEKKIPIVPVVIPFNWKILPDDGKFLLNWHPSKIIFLPPVSPDIYNIEDLEALKKNVYDIIQAELVKENNL